MSDVQVNWQSQTSPAMRAEAAEPYWYAVQTRCRFEKKVAAQLQRKGIETFLPQVKEIHRWSDRRQTIEVPLFVGYAFIRIADVSRHRIRVLETPGLMSFVTMSGAPVPVPNKQIEDVQRLLDNELSCRPYPFIRIGQKVRVRGGCLDGLQGILVAENKDHSLVISIEAIQRSVALRIEGYDIEPV